MRRPEVRSSSAPPNFLDNLADCPHVGTFFVNRFLNQFCRRSKSRFKSAFIVCVALILCSGLPGQQTIAGELDGSRASFLLDYKLSESSLNYLSYEMSDERRSQFRQRLKGLGDTHIYLYTQKSQIIIAKRNIFKSAW